MTRRRIAPIVAVLALLAGCDQSAAPRGGDPAKAESYAVHLPVTPAPGDGAQRLALPAAALVAQSRGDHADLRLFDGTGRLLPLAELPAEVEASQQVQDVPVYAVSGPVGEMLQGRDMVIRVENGAGVIVDARGYAPGTPRDTPVGALVDTRAASQPAVALDLAVDLPPGQPVFLTVSASADLKTWDEVGDKVLFRPAESAAPLGASRIDLGGASLKDRYLRIGWGAQTGVTIRSARLVTASSAPPPRIAVATTGAALEDPRHLRFDLGARAAPAAIRLTETGKDGIVPVTLYGRNNREQAWTMLGAGLVRQDERKGGNLVETGGGAWTSYRIEANERTSGFSAPPRVELLYDPVSVLTAFNGAPPYSLAAGLASAPPAWLSRSEIAPDDGPAPGALPLAQVTAAAPAPLGIAPAGEGSPFTGTRAMLWAVLLAATAVLALAAIRLLRGNASGDAA